MSETPPTHGFSEKDAHRALVAACSAADLDERGAQLIRLGENALYRLAHAPVVVRIARSVSLLPDVRRELAVASWLESAGFPSVRLVSDLPQARVHRGCVVTFWRFEESGATAPAFVDVAEALRMLHSLDKPAEVVLPLFDPLSRVQQRLDNATSVAERDLLFLRHRLKDLYDEYNALTFALPLGHIHGDAHKGNLLRRPDGSVILLDFEVFAFGPREWDLCSGLAIPYKAFRWLSDSDYAQAVDIYGFDVTRWSGFHTLRRIREVTMTTWLMQNVDHSPEIRAEFEGRVSSLRHDRLPRVWRAF